MTLKVFNFIVYATLHILFQVSVECRFLYLIDVALSYRGYLFFFFYI